MLKQHNITTAVRPNTTLRKLLVSPKDKIPKEKQCGVVYKVPCHNCNKLYIGKTGRQLGTRVEEHKKEVDDLCKAAYTRTKRKISFHEHNMSAITDHGVFNKHVINWQGVRIVDRESDMIKRRLREAIWIKRNKTTINRDEGAVILPRVWDNVVAAVPPSSTQKQHRF